MRCLQCPASSFSPELWWCQGSDGDFGNQYIFCKQFSRKRMCGTEKKCSDPLIVHYKILWRQWIWYFRHSQEEKWYSSSPTADLPHITPMPMVGSSENNNSCKKPVEGKFI